MPDLFNPDSSFLSAKQLAVIDDFKARKNILVTGGAGSGKSYLLNFLKQHYSYLGLEIVASTGIAAVNIGGTTLHSWAGIGLANLPPEQIVANILSGKFSRTRRRIRQTKILAIDEISMISAEVFELLDYVLRKVRENDAPMGGMQILLFGDFLQLPPITFGRDFNFCFQSEIWRELDFSTHQLTEIFRQSDQEFVKILNGLRLGNLDKNSREILNSRVKAEDKNLAIRPTILTTHNAKVEKINNEELKKIPREEKTYEAQYQGAPDKIEFLKKNCMALPLLKIKIGAQVMMIKNTYQKEGIINGSLGIVRDFSPKKSYPIVEFANGKILTIALEEWAVERYDETKGAIVIDAAAIQIPLILAWAMTIHKSQGLTLDKISCDLSDVFSAGQAYVALSRARSLEGVFIESINFERIFANSDAVNFYKNLS